MSKPQTQHLSAGIGGPTKNLSMPAPNVNQSIFRYTPDASERPKKRVPTKLEVDAQIDALIRLNIEERQSCGLAPSQEAAWEAVRQKMNVPRRRCMERYTLITGRGPQHRGRPRKQPK
jgi:hypothetical protein